ncbi:hypothetical protein BG58_32080 [Caballeronia jiangsuensis]|nr:hypothetical protein BG58_32080 [Caballeronia jiangsuensis]
MLDATLSRSTSSLCHTPSTDIAPAATVLMAAALSPARTNRWRSAHDTKVFPISVSVPVTKYECVLMQKT